MTSTEASNNPLFSELVTKLLLDERNERLKFRHGEGFSLPAAFELCRRRLTNVCAAFIDDDEEAEGGNDDDRSDDDDDEDGDDDDADKSRSHDGGSGQDGGSSGAARARKRAKNTAVCTTVLSSGDRVGQSCGKATLIGKDHCLFHQPRAPRPPPIVRPKCTATFSSGTACPRFCLDGQTLCEHHFQKQQGPMDPVSAMSEASTPPDEPIAVYTTAGGRALRVRNAPSTTLASAASSSSSAADMDTTDAVEDEEQEEEEEEDQREAEEQEEEMNANADADEQNKQQQQHSKVNAPGSRRPKKFKVLLFDNWDAETIRFVIDPREYFPNAPSHPLAAPRASWDDVPPSERYTFTPQVHLLNVSEVAACFSILIVLWSDCLSCGR